MCDQLSLRSACAYAQSDQSLCLSLAYSMTVKLLTEHHLGFPNLKGSCTGSSESTLVKMPHCWKSHVRANLFLPTLPFQWHPYLFIYFYQFNYLFISFFYSFDYLFIYLFIYLFSDSDIVLFMLLSVLP